MDEFYNGNPNPWQGYYPRPNMPRPQMPRRMIDRVHGREGAERIAMGPNEEAAVLDETAPILWIIKTDSAGYKVLTPFEIRPYQPKPPVDLDDLAARVKRMEEAVYAKSGTGSTATAADTAANPNP